MSTHTHVDPVVNALFAAGAHYGYSKARRHPSVAPYIFGTKNKTDLINLEKTKVLLEDAQSFVATLAKTGKTILFVGAKAEAKLIIQNKAGEIDMPWVTERWIGGALTNFPEIKKRIARLEELRDKKEKNELDMYTKKERLLLDQEMLKLQKKFGGLVLLKKAPDAMVVIDSKREIIAVTEAQKMGIPVIALNSTDTNITDIEYPIVANDSSLSSIGYIIGALVDSYKAARA
jgi:small subunit ribosomal protein S2